MSIKAVLKNTFPESVHNDLDALYSQITHPLYAGSDVYCPLCGGSFRKFLPHFEKPNVRCPKCRSYPRHRLQWLYLKKKTSFFKENMKLLHFAPERLLQKKIKKLENIDYTSADLCSRWAMVHTDITDLIFKDNLFDAFFCSHVLEHIEDDRLAMRELYRILKPDGYGLIMVPMLDQQQTYEDPSITDPKDREEHFGQFDHFRLYGYDIEERLREAGFQVTADRWVETLPGKTIAKFGLNESEIIYIVRKV